MKNERKEGKKALESRKTHCLATLSSHFHQLQTNHSPFISQLSLLPPPPPLIKTLFLSPCYIFQQQQQSN